MRTVREYPELANETLIPLAKLSEVFPVPISRPSIERAWRKGRLGVKLETIFLNGRRYSSVQAVSRFIIATQRTGEDISAAPTPIMPKCDIAAARKKYNLPTAGRNGNPAE